MWNSGDLFSFLAMCITLFLVITTRSLYHIGNYHSNKKTPRLYTTAPIMPKKIAEGFKPAEGLNLRRAGEKKKEGE